VLDLAAQDLSSTRRSGRGPACSRSVATSATVTVSLQHPTLRFSAAATGHTDAVSGGRPS